MAKDSITPFLEKLDTASVANTFAVTGQALEHFFDGSGKDKFPDFATLLANYPLPYGERPCKDKDRSGLPQISDPADPADGQGYAYFNQCAIRISICLMKSGVKLTGVKNVTNPGGGTKCSHGHVLGAKNLAYHLKNKLLGNTETFDGTAADVATLLDGRTGLLYFENFIEEGVRSRAAVHFELWDKDHYMSNFLFTQMFDATIIWFWQVD
jgi:hypothetical protein